MAVMAAQRPEFGMVHALYEMLRSAGPKDKPVERKYCRDVYECPDQWGRHCRPRQVAVLTGWERWTTLRCGRIDPHPTGACNSPWRGRLSEALYRISSNAPCKMPASSGKFQRPERRVSILSAMAQRATRRNWLRGLLRPRRASRCNGFASAPAETNKQVAVF